MILGLTALSTLASIPNRGDAYYAGATFLLLILWVGHFAERLTSYKRLRMWSVPLLALVFACMVFQQELYASLYRQPNAGYQATAWIQKQVPAGSLILRLEDADQGRNYWPLRFWNYTFRDLGRIPIVAQGFAEAIRPLHLRFNGRAADYLLVTTVGIAPESFSHEGDRFVCEAHFRAHSALERVFSNQLMPVYRRTYQIYKRLTPIDKPPTE